MESLTTRAVDEGPLSPPKLACGRLASQVTEWSEEWWSPEEIACRLLLEFPDDPIMWVSSLS